MKKNFWQQLKRPILAIAPMSGVTDEAFRLMVLKHGKNDVFWTEFVSADALCFAFGEGEVAKSQRTKRENAKKYCLEVLKRSKKEKPVVAQIFGSNPENFEKASAILAKMGFDGVDINMGCPDKGIESMGAGSALIKKPALAKEIIRATLRGAQGKKKNLPVSVKTRIGYSKNEIEAWIPALLEENISALTVHFRTKKEMYMPSAHWELAGHIVALRDKLAPETLILGNGDVKNLEQAMALAKQTGVDGVVAGRAAIGNPWIFCKKQPSLKKRLQAVLDHSKIFTKVSPQGNWESLKKHFNGYVKGFEGARELRDNIMRAKSPAELKACIKKFTD